MFDFFCYKFILASSVDLVERMTLQASGAGDKFLLTTDSPTVQFGFHPYDVGLEWNGSAWVKDVETVFAGTVNDLHGLYDTPTPTVADNTVVVLDSFWLVNSGGLDRIRVRWFPVSQQLVEGYYYGLASSPVDVVEFKSESSYTGMAFSEGVVTTNSPIIVGGGYYTYPF